MHYSYIYGTEYFYTSEIIELIEKVQTEREVLRASGLLLTTFAEDLKNEILKQPRKTKETNEKDEK